VLRAALEEDMTDVPDAQPLLGKTTTYTGRGGSEVIAIVDREIRAPGEGEIRIAVEAAAASPTDILLRDPGYEGLIYPVTPGMDAAGVVESVGPGVSRLKAGDRVMAAVTPRRPEGGAQARYIVAPAASAVELPDGSSFAEAATLPMNGLTALLALELAGLETGQFLAVSGGAGLLACYAIALAKHQGLKVIADAKTSDFDLVRGYGADIVIDRALDFAEAVRRELPDGAGALLDTALLGDMAFGALRDGGVYLPVRGWPGKSGDRGIEVRPVFVNEVLERTEWLERLRDLAADGLIKLRVAGEYPQEQTGEAQRVLSAGGVRGRPVITFTD
jgi:NADPH2:quinone reductase